MTINFNAIIGLLGFFGLLGACFSHDEMVRVVAYGFVSVVCAMFESRKKA